MEDPRDQEAHRASVVHWLAVKGYSLDHPLPPDVERLARSAGLGAGEGSGSRKKSIGRELKSTRFCVVEAGRDSDSDPDCQYPVGPDHLSLAPPQEHRMPYDPKFKLADGGLTVDTKLIESARRRRRVTPRTLYEQIGHDRNSGGVLWHNLMHGNVKTIGPVQRVCDALGLDIDDVLRPVDVDALRVVR